MDISGWSDKFEDFFSKTMEGLSYIDDSENERLERIVSKLDVMFRNAY